MALPRSPRSVLTGAGSGFGRAMALELARRSGSLVLSDIDERAVNETAELAREAGASTVVARRCDVTVVDDVRALAAAAEKMGGVDLVVNNAGVSSGGLVGDLPLEDWRWTLEVDLYGVVHGCHVFVPILKKQGSGHILNVASAAGLLSAPRMGAYNVAKAGVIALSETMSSELAGTGVGVTVLCPTFFRTNIVESGRFADAKTKQMAEKMMARGVGVEGVVKAALEAVKRDQLYAVPMPDARWFWRLKRVHPEGFRGLVARIAKRMS